MQTFISGNAFNFDKFLDQTNDNFAYATKRKRMSLFNKWSFKRPERRICDVALKVYYEDRIGGIFRYPRYRVECGAHFSGLLQYSLGVPFQDVFQKVDGIQEPIPLAPDRPFSNDFATDHVYDPLQDRRVLLGIRYDLK